MKKSRKRRPPKNRTRTRTRMRMRTRMRKSLGRGRTPIKDPYELLMNKVCGDIDLYIGDIMAGGSYYVYRLCADPKCDTIVPVVAKIYKIDGDKSADIITREVEFMRLANSLEVSPRVEGFELCEYDGVLYGVFLMELYGDGTLTDLIDSDIYSIEENREEINRKLREILDILYDNNISHNDLHSDNFLYKIGEGGDIELKIIDFDMADNLDDTERTYRIMDKSVLKKIKEKDFKTKIKMMKEGYINV